MKSPFFFFVFHTAGETKREEGRDSVGEGLVFFCFKKVFGFRQKETNETTSRSPNPPLPSLCRFFDAVETFFNFCFVSVSSVFPLFLFCSHT